MTLLTFDWPFFKKWLLLTFLYQHFIYFCVTFLLIIYFASQAEYEERLKAMQSEMEKRHGDLTEAQEQVKTQNINFYFYLKSKNQLLLSTFVNIWLSGIWLV